MTISDEEHRRARLEALADHADFGTKVALGQALGYRDGAYVGQLLRGERPITEKLTKKVDAIRGGKYRGWFADRGDRAPDAPAPSTDVVTVPMLATSASMGPGTEQHDDVVVGRLSLSQAWVGKVMNSITKPENLRFIHGYGDSMEPTFRDGDVLLVDGGVRSVSVDGVYVLNAQQRLFIKRVRQRLDGSFEISSDNQTVKTVDILDGKHEVDVLGKVVWIWNGRRL